MSHAHLMIPRSANVSAATDPNSSAPSHPSYHYDVTSGASPMRHLAETIAIGAILGVIVVVTVFGNLLVCVTVLTNRRMHNITNYFLVSLATSDLLLGLVVLPFSAFNTLGESWPFGVVFCNIYCASDVMLCTVSILTLFAISLDRYFAVTSPFRYQSTMSSRIVWKVSAAIWCFSFAMAFLPIHLGWNTPDGQVQNVDAPTACSLGLNAPYVLVVALGTYFAPLLVVCMVYVRVLRITRRQVREINTLTQASAAQPLRLETEEPGTQPSPGESRPGKTPRTPRCSPLPRRQPKPRCPQPKPRCSPQPKPRCPQDAQQKRHRIVSDRKATVNLASVVLAFAICWIPYFVLFIAKPFLPESLPIPAQLDLACLWLGYVNSSINPFLYAFYNSTFRDGFKRLLCSRWGYVEGRGGGSRSSGGMSTRSRRGRRSVESSWRDSPALPLREAGGVCGAKKINSGRDFCGNGAVNGTDGRMGSCYLHVQTVSAA